MPPGVSEYVVKWKKQETPTTVTLSLARLNGTIPHFRPGQYLTIYFLDLSPTLGKEYSISSAPSEAVCTITVQAIGRFSNRLCSLSPGEHLFASEPQGNFCLAQTSEVVLLAGGMGVTPFRSIIFETVLRDPIVSIKLFYSSHTSMDMPFGEELYRYSHAYHSFSIKLFVTKESAAFSEKFIYRRVCLEDIRSACNIQRTQFLISGSLHFVLELKDMLVTAGTPREHILTEAYF